MRFTAQDFVPAGIVWHFELTSRCTLRCPSCSRTVPRIAYEVGDLDLADIRTFFTADVLAQTRRVIYSGNLGDPIYHRHLAEVATFFRAAGKHQTVVTNGSWRPGPWWERLVDALDLKDIVIFSIDGLRDTNPAYRINSDWDSIMQAAAVCRGRVRMHWKYVAFAHNDHQIEDARELSQKLGFEKFLVVVSWRAKHEKTAPRDEKVASMARQSPSPPIDKPAGPTELAPKCRDGDHWFISHEGRFFPCCMMAATRRHLEATVFQREKSTFDIARHSLGDMLQSPAFAEFVETLNDPARTYTVCREKCATFGRTNETIVLPAG